MAAKKVTVKMSHVKETKGTHQFKEDEEDRAKQKIGTLYVPKKTLKALGDEQPNEITVSVSLGE